MKTKLIFALSTITTLSSIAQNWVPAGDGLVETNKKDDAHQIHAPVYDDPPEEHNGMVNTLAVYKDELYAGGYFKSSGSESVKNIAKWNGYGWISIGKGFEGRVAAMCVYKDELYVTGNFTKAGTADVKNIARWNGKEWTDVGGGLDSEGSDMIVFRDELVVVGYFTDAGGVKVKSAAKWNGSSWSALGKGVPNDIMAIGIYKDELYAGGTFIEAGSTEPNLFKWDGNTWKGVASFDGGVTGLASDGTYLYATGFFSEVKGKYISRMTQFDGKKWSPVGIQGSYQTRSQDKIGTLFYNNGILYASGRIWDENTKKYANGGKWVGGKWVHLATNELTGSISVFTVLKGELFAAGSFTVGGSMDFGFKNVAKIKLK